MKKTITLIILVIMIASILPTVSFADDPEPNMSDLYATGYIADDPQYILSIKKEPTPMRDGTLPSSVDLSTSDYFPTPVYQSGPSCTAYAATYYQFTYEANKYDNVTTTSNNAFHPLYVYALAKRNTIMGADFQTCYNVMKSIGCLRYSDYSGYTINNPSDYSEYIIDNTPAKYKALKTRLQDYSIEIDFSDFVGGNLVPKETIITFGTNTDTDHTFDSAKTLLAQGKVLTAALTIEGGFGYNGNGQYTMLYSTGSSDHAVTIVGYDDTFWYDLNGNGFQEAYELGAFKVANSWGAYYGNGGYFWILYDAFNKVSQSNIPASQQPDRDQLLILAHHYGVQERYISALYYIDIIKPTIYFVAKANVTAEKMNSLYMWCHRSDNTSTFISYPHLYYYDINSYNPNNDLNGYTTDQLLDYGILNTPFSTYYMSYTWCMKFRSFGVDSVNSCAITDDLGNTIATIDVSQYQPTSTPSSVSASVNLTMGDINYDGSLTNADKALMAQFITGAVISSNVQLYLGDFNGDGKITVSDYRVLKRLIDGDNLDDILDDELYDFIDPSELCD